jgi:hypothetical protein
MAADDAPRRPDGPPGRLRARVRAGGRPPVRKIVIGAGLVAYSWIAASTVPFTRNALLVVLLPGAVVATLAYGRPVRRIPRRTASTWPASCSAGRGSAGTTSPGNGGPGGVR